MNFPAWFFLLKGPRVPVVVTHFLPHDATDANGVVTGKRHWYVIDGTLFMSREAFLELKKVAAAGPDERPIVAELNS